MPEEKTHVILSLEYFFDDPLHARLAVNVFLQSELAERLHPWLQRGNVPVEIFISVETEEMNERVVVTTDTHTHTHTIYTVESQNKRLTDGRTDERTHSF